MLHSIETREQIMQAHKSGMRIPEISEACKVSERTVYRLIKHVQETGSIEPLPKPGRRKGTGKPVAGKFVLDEKEVERIKELIRSNPGISLTEIKDCLHLKIGITTIHRIVNDRLGFQKQYVSGNGPVCDVERIRALILSKPDISLAEIKEELSLTVPVPMIHMIINDILGLHKVYVQIDEAEASSAG